MTEARFRQRQHVMVRKVDAFFLAFVALMAAADPALFLSQLAASPATSTTADTQVESSGDIPSPRQPAAKPTTADLNASLRNVIGLLVTSDAAGLNAAVDVEISRRFNELRSELLDHQAKTVDWWLSATAIFLMLLGIVAAIAGYISFQRFREIETEARENVASSGKYAEEARNLVGQIKAKRDEATSLVKELTAETVRDDPDQVRRAAESVQENPTASFIDKAIAAAALLQRQGDTEEALEKWRAVANVVDGMDKETGARAWFSIGFLGRKSERSDPETAIDAYDKAIRLKPDLVVAYYNRGNAKRNLGLHEEAIADYDEAIRLKPDYARAYNNRGNAKRNLGLHEEAIADYDEAIRLKPDYARAYNNRGNAKRNLGLHEEAIADYALASNTEHALKKLLDE